MGCREIWQKVLAGSSVLGIAGAAMFFGSAASAQNFIYDFKSADPVTTSGSFTISGRPGAYNLSAFAGVVGGVAYDISSVGIRAGFDTSDIYLGGLVFGIDTPLTHTNDFEQGGGFTPGVNTFSSFFQYTTLADPSRGFGTSVDAILRNPLLFNYSYTSADPAKTSGLFTISGVPGHYDLSAFNGMVGGVAYDTSSVGIRAGSGTSDISLGGLVFGIDTPLTHTNDFEQGEVFTPGVDAFSSFFQYTTLADPSRGFGTSVTAILTILCCINTIIHRLILRTRRARLRYPVFLGTTNYRPSTEKSVG